MKNTMTAGLIMAVLASQSSYAGSLNSHDVERQSFEIAAQLNRMAQANDTDLCAGDITVAAAYIESAGRELQRDRYLTALTSLTYGHNELREISNTRAYCTHVATEVKPYLAKVILIKSELANEPPPDQTSD